MIEAQIRYIKFSYLKLGEMAIFDTSLTLMNEYFKGCLSINDRPLISRILESENIFFL